MRNEAVKQKERRMPGIFERFLSIWVMLCIIAGIALGKVASGVSRYLDNLAISPCRVPVASIPIAICLRTQGWFRQPQ